jgi:DNA-binding Lrp family transcriptional regulator
VPDGPVARQAPSIEQIAGPINSSPQEVETATKRENVNVSKKGEADADHKAFKTWRRRVVEQIICRGDLSPVARVTAYAIADLLNKDTRSTFASAMTIGNKVGLQFSEASEGLGELVKARQARTKKRENGTRDIFLELRNDVDTPELPIYADKAFFKTPQYRQFLADRARLLDAIFADERLSPTDKVIAFAAMRFIDVKHWVTSESYRTIGEAVGRSRETAKRSIRRLDDAGYFNRYDIDRSLALFPTALHRRRSGQSSGLDSGSGQESGRQSSGLDSGSGQESGQSSGLGSVHPNLRSANFAGGSAPNPMASRAPEALPSYRRPRSNAAIDKANPFDTLAAYGAEAASGPEASNEGVIAERASWPDAPPRRDDLLAEATFLLKARAPSARAFCYELVRKYYGKGKLGCVTNSLNTQSEEEVLADIIDVIKAGGDLGATLNWRQS